MSVTTQIMGFNNIIEPISTAAKCNVNGTLMGYEKMLIQ